MSECIKNDIPSFQAYLRRCRSVLALVGAGFSQSSGIPPFRGLNCEQWNGYDPAELSTPEAFWADPLLVWQFHAHCRQRALLAKPNPGHFALGKLANYFGENMLTVTQNFDGLTKRANHPPQCLVNLHGDLFRVRCTNVKCGYVANNFDANLGTESVPTCPVCDSNLRPAVVWFGESVSYTDIIKTNEMIETHHIDLVLCLGISATVWPAAGYISEVVQRGGKVAIFNPESGDVDCDWFFQGGSETWLPLALSGFV